MLTSAKPECDFKQGSGAHCTLPALVMVSLLSAHGASGTLSCVTEADQMESERMFTLFIGKYYSMSTVQLHIKISGTILNDVGFCNKTKCQLSTQTRLQLHQEIHSPEVLLQGVLTNNTMALQITLGPRGGVICSVSVICCKPHQQAFINPIQNTYCPTRFHCPVSVTLYLKHQYCLWICNFRQKPPIITTWFLSSLTSYNKKLQNDLFHFCK